MIKITHNQTIHGTVLLNENQYAILENSLKNDICISIGEIIRNAIIITYLDNHVSIFSKKNYVKRISYRLTPKQKIFLEKIQKLNNCGTSKAIRIAIDYYIDTILMKL